LTKVLSRRVPRRFWCRQSLASFSRSAPSTWSSHALGTLSCKSARQMCVAEATGHDAPGRRCRRCSVYLGAGAVSLSLSQCRCARRTNWTHTHAHTHARARTHTHTHTRTHAHTHTRVTGSFVRGCSWMDWIGTTRRTDQAPQCVLGGQTNLTRFLDA
jgi:hypothetical protein